MAAISFCRRSWRPGYMVVLPFRRGDDLDLDRRRRHGGDILLQALLEARVHGGTSAQHDVAVQVLPDVHVALHDGVEGRLVDSLLLHTNKRGLEEDLGGPEALVANGDDIPVRELVLLLQRRGGLRFGHLLLIIESDVAKLLLGVPDNLPLCAGGEAVASLRQDFLQVVGDVPARQVDPHDGMGEGEALVDGHTVRDAVAAVQDHSSGPAAGVQREHGLDRQVDLRGVEGLEHDLGHLLAV